MKRTSPAGDHQSYAQRQGGMTDIRAITPADWDGFFAVLREADVPADFLDRSERDQGGQDRDPFAEWHE